MSTGIYCILNTANSKRYIGQSVDLSRRKSFHFTHLRNGTHKNHHLQAAFNHYGASCFRWIIIELVPNTTTLDVRERHWIALYASNSPVHGYNSESGGLTRPRASCATRWRMQKAQSIRREREYGRT
jgi:group I intron endonuclease